MTLPPFAYARPQSLGEATALLATDGARALAGGQSLVPALAARQPGGPRPRLLVELARLPGLDLIALAPDGRLRIGALVRQRAAERSPLVAAHAPLLAQALAQVGHPSTRNRGTVVGSLAHAEPAAEVPAVAVALGGVAVIAGPGGARRELAVSELLQGPQRIALAPGELIAELLLDPLGSGERQAWLEFAPRRFDLPLVGVAARVAPGQAPRLTFAGIAPTPTSVTSTPEQGVDLTEVAPGLDPHRARVARTLARRAVEECGR